MRLKTKIALPWFFIVVLAIGSLGFWSASIIQRNLDEESHTFLKTILSSYVTEVLQQRQDILEANNLQDVPSYVQQYQQSAMQAAGEINFFWSGWIMAHDRRGKRIFTTGRPNEKRVPEQFWQGNQAVLLGLAHGESAQGFIADKQFFLSTYYQPWGWYLTAVVDQAPLHQSVREVRMATLFWIAGVIVVSIAFLAWVTHFVLISPINSLRRAAAQISSGNYIDRVNVESADDLGDLARDIEAMSTSIQEKERQLQETNDQLELRVQERTRQLSIRNEELDRSQARLQWALRRDQLLAETAAQLLRSENPQALIEELCCRVMDFIGCQVFLNFLNDSKQGKLHLNAFGGIGDQQAEQIEWLEYGAAVCGWVAQNGRPMVCEDIQDRDDALTSLIKSFGIKAYCCHPLMVGDRLVGTLSFGRRAASSFDQEEVELMAQVTNLAAVAMNRITIENRLRESESRFRSIVENAPEPIFIQTEMRLAYLNPKALDLFGAKNAGELLGTPVMERFHPDYHEIVRGRIRTLNEDRQSIKELLELKFIRLDGTTVWGEATGEPIVYHQKNGALVFVRDISTRKRAEQEREKLQDQLLQAQKMESVGRLAGGVAHDFNNMLSVILGNAELALGRVNTEKEMEDSMRASLQDSLQEIHHAAHRSAEITRQLLAFARRQNIEPQVLDLNETVEKMLNMLRRLIGEDIDLLWKPGSGLWPVKIDPSQLDQILANLCVNARDAITDVGRITIETDNVRFDEEYCAHHPGFVVGEYVLLAVSDDGCGMDKETREKIFEPFYTTKDASTGTGLGLAMIYGIVKQNQGFINVYSEPERGTTFRIYFPRHAEEAASVQQQVVEEIPPGAGETVLVVEDEAAILKLTRKILENRGYKVLQATNPIEAMARVKELAGEVDLLITDVVMPEMNGRDLAEKLQADYPHLKVLFMSGYTANVIAHHGVLDEGVQFIQKPFSGRDLAEKILEVMD